MMDVLARLASGMRVVFLDGLSIFRLAPIIPLLVIVPEFIQHVYEIQAGMFENKGAFNALAQSDTRWLFGYLKIAGLLLAVLAAARFIGGAGKRWWDPRTVAWKQFGIALAVNIAATLLVMAAEEVSGGELPMALDIALQIALLPLVIYLVGPLFGDTSMTLRRAYSVGWAASAMLVLYMLVSWGPAQLLHQYNHTLAMGQSDALVWALMVWDTLLVGIMACWMGASIAAGYWLGRPPVTAEG